MQIRDLFVAPGYNLTVTGNGLNYLSLLTSKKVTGMGAESNKYSLLRDSILYARMDTTNWYSLNKFGLLAYAKKFRQLKDSVANQVFNRPVAPDKYFNYFGKMVRFDNEFLELHMLLSHVNTNHYNYDEAVAFIQNNTNKSLLNNLFRDEYLASNDYKTWVIGNEYLNYLLKLDCLRDPSLCNKMNYKLEIVNKVYKGKAKEYTLQKLMDSYISFCKSLAKLNEYKEQLEPYISALKDSLSKESIYTSIAKKETELVSTQVGKPAPAFTLKDDANNIYALEDFKGKVVYIDLWASWCHPCRAETPSFKVLYEKYKANQQIAFISIAVHDGVNEWKKALAEDKPLWLQLLDKDGVVWKSYVANTIPKFILINKKGNIVNFDAPRPSSSEKIEALLNREIEKQ